MLLTCNGCSLDYEFERIPCAHQAFFNNGRAIKTSVTTVGACADPRTPVGGPACCDVEGNHVITNPLTNPFLPRERVSFEKAFSRCEVAGLQMCEAPYSECPDNIPCLKEYKLCKY